MIPDRRNQRRSARLNRVSCETLEQRLLFNVSVFTVTTTVDTGAGSLRQAILDSNSDTGQTNTIDFDIPTTDPNYNGQGEYVITPATQLPTITQAVDIDGTSESGYSGRPLIYLTGGSLGTDADGLVIQAGNSSVSGLNINLFSGDGIEIAGASSVSITANYLGTGYNGESGQGNGIGVQIDYGAQDNTIGGTAIGAGNLISGNTYDGISIDGESISPQTTGNNIEGNLIGVDLSGDNALGNGTAGVLVDDGAQSNTIGGTAATARNVISGNGNGINITGTSSGPQTTGNLIEGNFVGTDYAGTTAIPNTSDGVFLSAGAQDNTIGGAASGAGNVISGNTNQGIDIDGTTTGPQTSGNFIEGNYIGVDETGENPLANGDDGILLDLGAQNNTIGGTTAGARNVISSNHINGVEIDGTLATPETTGNVVEGNYIGYDAACTADNMGNGAVGVYMDSGASDNIVGGSLPADKNDIVYNGDAGVAIGAGAGDSTTIDNAIRLNSIFGNGGLGIDLANDGVTGNSPGTRSGPNDFQNYPVLTSAVSDGSSFTTVQGSLNSLTGTQFVIDFYSTPTLGPGDSAQGETYLGSSTVTTDGSGNASFNATFTTPVTAGQYVTATATTTALAPDGDTSEFSAPVQVTAGSPPVTSGNLVGAAAPAGSGYNVTSLGTTDWAAWGRAGVAANFDHDASGGSQISNVTRLGPGTYGGYSDNSRTVSWTNGTPTVSDAADHGYIWANNAIGAGYSFTVPASTTKQTLTIYLGGYSAAGTLNAHLSDNSSPDYSVTLSNSSHFTDVVTISFKANSPGQTLTLTYAKSQTIGAASGSVDLIAAWLAGPPAAPVVTLNPLTQSVPVGTPVTFTAAATGTPSPTVQWEISTNDGGSFSPILGATSTTLSIGTANLTENGDEYEAIFTNAVTSTATTAATLTVTAPTGGILVGNPGTSTGNYNLTTVGTLDWAHWGRGGNGKNFDHDKTGGSQISNVTRLGPGSYGGYTDASRTVEWTNGTPTASDSADHGYIWANNATGAGYQFTVAAGTTARTLHIYFGGYDSSGTISANLSDGSASSYSIGVASAGHFQDVLALTFKAASANQTLTITYTKGAGDATSGSVDLIAAWLTPAVG